MPMIWKLHMRVWLWMTAAGLLATLAGAEDFNHIEYLCCDWGPAMTLPSKTNAAPQFSDTEEEIYFLKQVWSFTRKKFWIAPLLGGRDHEDIGRGISIFLCKMKADGSGKTEIKELWKNPAYPIDTQDQSTWMSVNAKTRTIAFSVKYAGSDLTGLWTVNLNGCHLQRIIAPTMIEGHLQAIDRPSWTPDGLSIVFAEVLRGGRRNRIAKCDRNGKQFIYLTEGPSDIQPVVSPDGTKVAYLVISATKGGVWIINADGTDAHLLPNPDDKLRHHHGGLYPAWSPDGKQILIIGSGSACVDVLTGCRIFNRRPELQGNPQGTCGWPHWGRTGIVGFTVGGILFTGSDLKEAKWVGSSRLVSLSASKPDDGRW
jgi:hypothetical protein